MSGVLSMKKSYSDEEVIYESKFSFQVYEIDEVTSKEIAKKEEVIIKNISQIQRNRVEMAQQLWEIHDLLANYKNGVFYAYLGYIEVKKDTAYRLIDMWNIYLIISDKKVFEQSHSLIKKLKNGLRDKEMEEAEIIEIIDAESPKNKLQELSQKDTDEVTMLLDYQNEINKIDREIVKYEKKLIELREKRKQLEEKI